MTGLPDLGPARAAVEALMVDTCKITRDPEGRTDDMVDPATLRRVAHGFPTTVYEGPCMIRLPGGEREVENQPRDLSGGRAGIPIGAPEVRAGDLFTVTGSLRDPLLVDRTARVTGSSAGTFSVLRTVHLEEAR